jgi:hypothetical protein
MINDKTPINNENGISEIPDRNRINFAVEKLEGMLDLMYAIKDGLDHERRGEGEDDYYDTLHNVLKGFHYLWAQIAGVLMLKVEVIDEIFGKIESGELFEHFMKSDLPEDLKKIFSQ